MVAACTRTNAGYAGARAYLQGRAIAMAALTMNAGCAEGTGTMSTMKGVRGGNATARGMNGTNAECVEALAFARVVI